MVECKTVNFEVAGSSPALEAIKISDRLSVRIKK
jgi:hypothetical protein